MVSVQFVVKVPDVERFIATAKKYESVNAGFGAKNMRVWVNQNDPSEVSMIADWESHDAMHEASEKIGEDFNREAGTEGLDWITYVWEER